MSTSDVSDDEAETSGEEAGMKRRRRSYLCIEAQENPFAGSLNRFTAPEHDFEEMK